MTKDEVQRQEFTLEVEREKKECDGEGTLSLCPLEKLKEDDSDDFASAGRVSLFSFLAKDLKDLLTQACLCNTCQLPPSPGRALLRKMSTVYLTISPG